MDSMGVSRVWEFPHDGISQTAQNREGERETATCTMQGLPCRYERFQASTVKQAELSVEHEIHTGRDPSLGILGCF